MWTKNTRYKINERTAVLSLGGRHYGENRIGEMPSFSYTVNGELNSFRTPVYGGVVRLARLALRITLAHRPRPRQCFRTGRPDTVDTAHREPPDASALVGGHEFPMEPGEKHGVVPMKRRDVNSQRCDAISNARQTRSTGPPTRKGKTLRQIIAW